MYVKSRKGKERKGRKEVERMGMPSYHILIRTLLDIIK